MFQSADFCVQIAQNHMWFQRFPGMIPRGPLKGKEDKKRGNKRKKKVNEGEWRINEEDNIKG